MSLSIRWGKIILAAGIVALVVILLGVQCHRKRTEHEFNEAWSLLAQYGYLDEESNRLGRQTKMLKRMWELEKLVDAYGLLAERKGLKVDKDVIRAEMKAEHFPDLP